jgi:hypothetical protein
MGKIKVGSGIPTTTVPPGARRRRSIALANPAALGSSPGHTSPSPPGSMGYDGAASQLFCDGVVGAQAANANFAVMSSGDTQNRPVRDT